VSIQSAAILFLVACCLFAGACGGASTSGGDPGHGTFTFPKDPVLPPPDGQPGPGGEDPTPAPELVGGVLVTVDTGGEIWHWWVRDPVTADYLERAWNGTYSGSFSGTLRAGPGAADHNAPWSWHVDPDANGHALALYAPPNPPPPSTPSQCENGLSFYLYWNSLFVPNPFTIVAFRDYR